MEQRKQQVDFHGCHDKKIVRTMSSRSSARADLGVSSRGQKACVPLRATSYGASPLCFLAQLGREPQLRGS